MWNKVLLRAPWRLAVPALLCLLTCAAAAQTHESGENAMSIRMEGGALEQNTSEMVAALIDRGLLTMEPHTNDGAATPAQFISDKMHWPAAVVTDAMSLALCRQNGHACAVDNDHAIWRFQKTPMGHQATAQYKCGDPALPPWVLCLPKVKIEPYIAAKRVVANPATENIGVKVTRDLRGCQNYDENCKRSIARLNPDGVRDLGNGVATMMLPARALHIQLYGNEAAREQFDAARADVVDALRQQNGLTRASKDIRTTVPLKARQQSMRPPTGAPAPAAPARTPLELMDYDRGIGVLMPNKPIVIGVWDGYADANHCVFKRPTTSAIAFYDNAPMDPGVGLPPKGQCGEQREFGGPTFDHATFVSSLIVGRSTPPVVVGADPDALIWQLEYVGDRVNEDVVLKAMDAAQWPDNVKVINISQDFIAQGDASQSQLAKIIDPDEGYGKTFTFVAAAGNDGIDTRGPRGCFVIPACWSRVDVEKNGLISVVALDTEGGRLLPGSNRGLDFDVAAIGDTIGAVYGGGHAHGTGTSFAAPYVSALAAMLYERVEREKGKISPLRVKHRILFTSTFIDGLEDQVRFGRISFARAIDFKEDVLRLRPGSCAPPKCVLRGSANPSTSVTFAYALDESGKPVTDLPLFMRDIKRIQATKLPTGETRFWVVVRKKGALQRYSAVKFADTSMAFTGMPKLAMADILDYTACSFSKSCDGDLSQ